MLAGRAGACDTKPHQAKHQPVPELHQQIPLDKRCSTTERRALCTVPSLGAAAQIAQESPQLHQWFVQGKWFLLARLYMLILGVGTAGGAVLWAAEATAECGLDWLIDWIVRKRRAAAKHALPLAEPA